MKLTTGPGVLPRRSTRLDGRSRRRRWLVVTGLGGAAAGSTLGVVASAGSAAQAEQSAFLSQFHNVVQGASTVPADGDVNPYGIATVPQTVGKLVAGGVLVSNFNDQANAQGTGSTIVQQHPDGSVTRFARIRQTSPSGPCPGGIGLTTALTILPGGWVVVGSLPTLANGASDAGTPAGIGAGCLSVLEFQWSTRRNLVGESDQWPLGHDFGELW